jgi:hypothetical protein
MLPGVCFILTRVCADVSLQSAWASSCEHDNLCTFTATSLNSVVWSLLHAHFEFGGSHHSGYKVAPHPCLVRRARERVLIIDPNYHLEPDTEA